IVMEKHRNYIIVMRKDGTFQKAQRPENASVGMEISYKPISGKHHPLFRYFCNRRHASFQIPAILFLLLLLMPVYLMTDKNQTYAYVNISINPNIELEIDEQLNVKSIVPLNDDAESVLSTLTDYEGDQLETVIEKIMTESEKENLLQNGKNMLAGVSYLSEAHHVSVTDVIDEFFLNHGEGWEIVTFQIPKDIREKAHNSEQSMNQLMTVNFIESESSGDNNTSAAGECFVEDNERDIIHSFYKNEGRHSGSAAETNKTADTGSKTSSGQKDSRDMGSSDKMSERQESVNSGNQY